MGEIRIVSPGKTRGYPLISGMKEIVIPNIHFPSGNKTVGNHHSVLAIFIADDWWSSLNIVHNVHSCYRFQFTFL